uniref:uncharacterized protein LOC106999454 n=1 Tax=Macaca mulatta TaxID=9544 RepID=UPI0010A2256B|nr:uncharacterized protein LOC106999454 [Macaca mulatta]
MHVKSLEKHNSEARTAVSDSLMTCSGLCMPSWSQSLQCQRYPELKMQTPRALSLDIWMKSDFHLEKVIALLCRGNMKENPSLLLLKCSGFHLEWKSLQVAPGAVQRRPGRNSGLLMFCL